MLKLLDICVLDAKELPLVCPSLRPCRILDAIFVALPDLVVAEATRVNNEKLSPDEVCSSVVWVEEMHTRRREDVNPGHLV